MRWAWDNGKGLTRNRVDGGFWFTLAYIHLPESRRDSLGAAVDSTCAERSLIRAYRPSHKSAATCSKEIVGQALPPCLGEMVTRCGKPWNALSTLELVRMCGEPAVCLPYACMRDVQP